MNYEPKKTVHLICNAHLDPAWLWQWEEGAAEAISTFRVAADFCEDYEGFIFNHNEAILYKWVEEYEPALFSRIQKLVSEGRWHIMGGWYLQPDCNMPSGESFVRQILAGRLYFKEKFGVEPAAAINFDSFGHTRGLVQILKKSGFDSYVFTRPHSLFCPLESENFIWVGYDGSEITGLRAYQGYATRGESAASGKVRSFMNEQKDQQLGLILWGIGNHGGGPSRKELKELADLMIKTKDFHIVHSTPEAYFRELKASGASLPTHEKDLNPMNTGCYTSQIRLKQKHRLLENELYRAEKMLSCASMQGYLEYPQKELQEVLHDLMTVEFHDMLPGSSIPEVEEDSLRLMDHGLEILSRLNLKAFLALASGQEKASDGEIPVFIYNHHPYTVSKIFELEFSPEEIYRGNEFVLPEIYQDGKELVSQGEREHSSLLGVDWRKRIIFAAQLKPGQMNRLHIRVRKIPNKPEMQLKAKNGKITFKTDELEVVTNCSTGLIDKYEVNGFSYLKENAFLPLVMQDDDDSWGMRTLSFREREGEFKLMSKQQTAGFCAIDEEPLPEAVRIVEDGHVRTVVEALFTYGDSFICQTYILPKAGTQIQVQTRVYWNEKARMLKLSIPTVFEGSVYMGQVAYGVSELPNNGTEAVAQKWTGVLSEKEGKALTCINDGIYGSDCKGGEMRLSLLRSPAYAAASLEKPERRFMPRNRFFPRMDQGERIYNIWVNCGKLEERLSNVDREALIHNEAPYMQVFFPPASGSKPEPSIILDDDAVQMTAFKKAERSEEYIIRLFEPTGKKRHTRVKVPSIGLDQEISLDKFEIKTLKFDLHNKILIEADLLERSGN